MRSLREREREERPVDEVQAVQVGEDREDLAKDAFLFRLGVRGMGICDQGEGGMIDEKGV